MINRLSNLVRYNNDLTVLPSYGWFVYYVSAAGHLDIICLEDIIHQVVTVGPHFKDVNTFLLLFRLNPPAGGWKKRSRLFASGGECGPRGDKINELLRRMI